MDALINALLKTENIAILVLAVGNVAQHFMYRDLMKTSREDRKADASATGSWMDKVSDGLRDIERVMAVMAERLGRRD